MTNKKSYQDNATEHNEKTLRELEQRIYILEETVKIYEARENELKQAAEVRGGPIISAKRKDILVNEFQLRKDRDETWKQFNQRIQKDKIRTEKNRIAAKAQSGLADLIFILEHWDHDPSWILVPEDVRKIIERPNHKRIDDVFKIESMQQFVEILSYRYLNLPGDTGRKYILQLIFALQRSIDRTWNSGDLQSMVPADCRPVPLGKWNIQLSLQSIPLDPDWRAAGF